MSVDDELRRLDEEVAAGRLSAQDYRRRRDELIAQAASPPTRSASAPRVPEGPAPSPFPPAFRWETAAPDSARTDVFQPVPREPAAPPPDPAGEHGAPDADRTQVVPRGEAHGSAQPAQPGQPTPPARAAQPGSPAQSAAAPPWATAAAPPAPQQGSAPFPASQPPPPGGPGTPARGVPLPTPPGGPGTPARGVPLPPPPGSTAGPTSSPPWARPDEPAPAHDAWLQGPRRPSRASRLVGLSLVAVLLLGLVTAGVLYLVTRDGEPDPAAATAPPTTPTSAPTTTSSPLPEPPAPVPAPAETPDAVVDPPGAPRGGGGLLDLPGLQGSELLPAPVVEALTAGGMTDGVLKTTTEGESTLGLFALRVRDEAAATAVVEAYAAAQRDGGLRVDSERLQNGLQVYGTSSAATTTVRRGMYVLYDRAILFEVFGPDQPAVLGLFDGLTDAQLTLAPPTVREG